MTTCKNGNMFFQIVLVEVCYENLTSLHYNLFLLNCNAIKCNGVQLENSSLSVGN